MKIFGIGLTRTGSLSLTVALRVLGFRAYHNPISYDLINQFDACTDTAVAARYKVLDLFHPGSKFILTTRDLESWITSAEVIPRSVLDGYWKLETRALLYNSLVFDKDKFIEAYVRHHREVQNYFKNRELLILDLRDENKWEKLCSFLGKNIPNCNYPHLNTRQEVLNAKPIR